jgi:hypothetical protein
VEYKPILNGNFFVEKVCEKEDSVRVNYLIEPKDDDAAREVGGESGRSITIRTGLKNAIIDAVIRYASGASVGSSSTPGKDFLNIKVSKYDPIAETSLNKIEVKVQGDVPSIPSRIEEVRVVWFDIQEAEENSLPAVVILVIDHPKFKSDKSLLKKQYDNLSAVLDEYAGKVDTLELSNYLSLAFKNITLAETYYGGGEYRKANEMLGYAENWLEKVDSEAKKVKAKYAHNQAKKKLDDVAALLDGIDLLMEEVESEKLVNTSVLLSYKTEYRGLQRNSEALTEDLAAANAYIKEGRYEEAESKALEVLNSALELENSANFLCEGLRSLISAETSATPKDTQGISISIDYKLVGVIAGVTAAIVLGAIGASRYRKRRKWDELK